MNTRRGLTLVEMLMALLLLTGIVTAVASWTSVAGRLGYSAVEPMRTRSVAEAVFARIQEDLVCGDFNLQATKRSNGQHEQFRVRVADDALAIDARAGEARVYRLDRTTKRLECSERGNETPMTRVLMAGVAEFTCILDDEERWLTVDLVTQGDDADGRAAASASQRFTWRLRLP